MPREFRGEALVELRLASVGHWSCWAPWLKIDDGCAALHRRYRKHGTSWSISLTGTTACDRHGLPPPRCAQHQAQVSPTPLNRGGAAFSASSTVLLQRISGTRHHDRIAAPSIHLLRSTCTHCPA